jgi:hypothetical protein
MIDIETMSTRHDALVLSFAAQAFELRASGPWLGDTLVHVLCVREQLALGRHVEHRTVQWWAHLDRAAAREHWLRGQQVAAQVALQALTGFLQLHMGSSGSLWANGAAFDVTVLETLYSATGWQAVPWRYNAVRDARTVYRVCPQVRTLGESSELTPHEPLADCVAQVFKLWEHWPGELAADPVEEKPAAAVQEKK